MFEHFTEEKLRGKSTEQLHVEMSNEGGGDGRRENTTARFSRRGKWFGGGGDEELQGERR